jgi:hypothetical protein
VVVVVVAVTQHVARDLLAGSAPTAQQPVLTSSLKAAKPLRQLQQHYEQQLLLLSGPPAAVQAAKGSAALL